MPDLAGRATYLAYRAAAVAADALPTRLSMPLARVSGRVAARAMSGRRHQMARHQRRVAALDAGADVDQRVTEAFESYARYWLEMFRLPADVRAGVVMRNITVEGFDHIEAGLERGHGAIVALPHLGGWEWAAAWTAERGHRILAVVEPVNPPELFEWFRKLRADMGADIVPLGPGVSATVVAALRDNRIVCLVSDRDLTGDGVEVDFFGERTRLPGGPATLALRTGATLVPTAVYFRPGRDHLAVVRPPLAVERQGRLRDDITRITQALAYEFEELIRAAPEQWHLMQPNWPSDREG